MHGNFPLLFLKDASTLEGLCMPDCVLTYYNRNNQSSCVLVGQMALLYVVLSHEKLLSATMTIIA